MYFGSVKFFKHLILVVVVILIALPTGLAFRFYDSQAELRESRQKLYDEVTRLHKEVTNGKRQLAEKETELAKQAEQLSAVGAGDLSPESIYYQKLYPDFYAPQPYQASERTPGTVYLTFDGGPSSNTSRILEILEEEGVKATFFVTGQSDETGYQLMRDIAEQGHTLGMHSYSQDYAKIYGSVESCMCLIYKIF